MELEAIVPALLRITGASPQAMWAILGLVLPKHYRLRKEGSRIGNDDSGCAAREMLCKTLHKLGLSSMYSEQKRGDSVRALKVSKVLGGTEAG